MNTFRDMTLPLLFPDLRINKKRFKYVKPYIKWIRGLSSAYLGNCIDLPLSDLEYKFVFTAAAYEQGRIDELEYKKIKKYAFT